MASPSPQERSLSVFCQDGGRNAVNVLIMFWFGGVSRGRHPFDAALEI
jgi:hypothetical protein